MKVELWSDYVCPFCYVGKKRLEIALNKLGIKEETEIVMKSYELDPYLEEDANLKTYDYLQEKYNMSLDKVKEMTEGIEAQAEEVGLSYDFSKYHQENTHKAHRLVKYAETLGKGREMSERILQAYFNEYKRIGKKEVLLELAVEVGLDREEVDSFLCLNKYSKQVKSDMEEARDIGVQGVPFFVINEKYALSGAQPQEVFIEALEKVLEEENEAKSKLKPLGSAETSYCTDEGCK